MRRVTTAIQVVILFLEVALIRYICGRLLRALISMFIVLSVVFCLMRLMPVEGYFGSRSDAMNDKVKQQVLQQLGLLDPLPVQLAHFWRDIFHGDLGKSIVYRVGQSNAAIIASKAPYSLWFGLAALIMQKLIGLPLGVIMARWKGKFFDKIGNIYILLINAVPEAVYFLLIQLYISEAFHWPMLYKAGKPNSYILPVVCLALGGIAADALWMRRYMVDEMNKDYIRLAQAKGMTASSVAFKHVLRNAFIPMAQSLPYAIIFTISGSLYIESLFSIPGMGGLLVTAIQRQDNTLVQAMVLLYSAMSVGGLLLGDLLMMLCDPRIRLTNKKEARA
jgi:oligopeptide transport system permease protein